MRLAYLQSTAIIKPTNKRYNSAILLSFHQKNEEKEYKTNAFASLNGSLSAICIHFYLHQTEWMNTRTIEFSGKYYEEWHRLLDYSLSQLLFIWFETLNFFLSASSPFFRHFRLTAIVNYLLHRNFCLLFISNSLMEQDRFKIILVNATL